MRVIIQSTVSKRVIIQIVVSKRVITELGLFIRELSFRGYM